MHFCLLTRASTGYINTITQYAKGVSSVSLKFDHNPTISYVIRFSLLKIRRARGRLRAAGIIEWLRCLRALSSCNATISIEKYYRSFQIKCTAHIDIDNTANGITIMLCTLHNTLLIKISILLLLALLQLGTKDCTN